jgi:NAD+ synthase
MAGRALHSITREDVDAIIDFIKEIMKSTDCKGLVVGASGGLDSVVVTKLCVDAIGAENVLNLFMPSAVTPPADRAVTADLSRKWGTRYEVVDIRPAADAFERMLLTDTGTPLEMGNISARCRMIVLYNKAKKLNYLVAGTSNRSEHMMGYFTKYGDGASDLVPIIDLYKTQVRQVAEMIGVPREIIDKVPTAGLWEGQTDEGEMGITYRDLDIVLDGMTFGMPDGEIAKDASVGVSKVSEIRARVTGMEHKKIPAYRPDIAFNDPDIRKLY